MKIGNLKEYRDAGGSEFHGYIACLNLDLTLRLIASSSQNSNAPDYIVMAKNETGRECQIGAVWKKQTSRNVDGVITDFLSLTLDDPSFARALNVAAFPTGKGEWDITWRRRQAQAENA